MLSLFHQLVQKISMVHKLVYTLSYIINTIYRILLYSWLTGYSYFFSDFFRSLGSSFTL